jgi:hypothetical protein
VDPRGKHSLVDDIGEGVKSGELRQPADHPNEVLEHARVESPDCLPAGTDFVNPSNTEIVSVKAKAKAKARPKPRPA